MALETLARPAVLRDSTQQELQPFLRFRHLVRNLYADELRPEPIILLLDDLPPLWQDLALDLEVFESWAEGVAQGVDG